MCSAICEWISSSDMDSDYIQFIRYKLQKRLKRLNTASQESFRAALVQTWAFLGDDGIFSLIPDARPDADRGGKTRIEVFQNWGDATA